MESANKVDVQNYSIARILFDAVNGVVRIKPVALLEDAGTRDGMVDATKLIICVFEQLIDVVVVGHIAFQESSRFIQSSGGGDIDVSKDYVRAMLNK